MSAQTEPANEAVAAPARFSLKTAVVEWSIVSLIAASVGAMLATLDRVSPASSPNAPAASTSVAGAAPVCATSTANLMDLPPIVTNLNSPSDTWVRVEASIVFDAKTTPHSEIIAAEIATDELAYLRTISLAQLQGPIGLENIRQDLTDRAVTRSGGKVSEFVLRTLVVQ
jgi:flagellar FliL protein